MKAKETTSIVPLIEGKFTAEEAMEIIEKLVYERLRFHHIQMMRGWECNHQFDSAHFDKKIKEIQAEKNAAKTMIQEAEKDGYKVEIVSTIQVKICKPVVNHLKLEIANNLEMHQN